MEIVTFGTQNVLAPMMGLHGRMTSAVLILIIIQTSVPDWTKLLDILAQRFVFYLTW